MTSFTPLEYKGFLIQQETDETSTSSYGIHDPMDNGKLWLYADSIEEAKNFVDEFLNLFDLAKNSPEEWKKFEIAWGKVPLPDPFKLS